MTIGPSRFRRRLGWVCHLMAGFPRPWFFCGGWALDLHAGRPTRRHKDIEIGIFRHDQRRLHRHLAGWRLAKAVKGRLVAWRPTEYLRLPVHEIHAFRGHRRLEILLNEMRNGRWLYRRHPGITRAGTALTGRSPAGPYLAPEVVLLYKSRGTRPKDQRDWSRTVPGLNPLARSWLKRSIAAAEGPEHPWLRPPPDGSS